MRFQERTIVLAIIAVVVAVTALPYIYGFVDAPPGAEFTGLVGQNGSDQAFYLGWGPRQAELGHWLFEDKYNGHTERRAVFNPLWLAMGWASRATGIPVVWIMHLQRTAFSVALILVSWRFMRMFLTGVGARVLALCLLAFSSGFGVFRIPLNSWTDERGIFAIPPQSWTPDLWIVESNIFLTMLWECVLPAGTVLFLLAIEAGFHSVWQRRFAGYRAGAWTLLMGAVYPYAVVSVDSILLVAALTRWRRTKDWGALRDWWTIALISAPVVLYDGYLVLTNPKLTVGQAGYASPNPWLYFLSFGVVGIAALAGIYFRSDEGNRHFGFLFCWLGATAAQIYAPRTIVPFQMQLILGVQVPLVILAAHGVCAGAARFREFRSLGASLARIAVATLFGTLSVATTAYHYRNVVARLDLHQLPEYIDHPTLEAIRWLSTGSREDEVVLSSPMVAPYIPVISHNRMYFGNYEAPTADFARKYEAVRQHLLRRRSEEFVSFLRTERIAYLFYDQHLAELGGGSAWLDGQPALQRVFANTAVKIYRVSPQ